jgi:RNA recognition motif-containing protein
MSTKLYVGNLPDSVKEKDLRELFSSFGEVDEIAVFKGYGFVVSIAWSFITKYLRATFSTVK